MNTILLAIVSVGISVMAQLSLKTGMSNELVKQALTQALSPASVLTVLLNKFVLIGFALYGLGALVWLGVLSKWEVSKAYPMVGLGFAMTALVGMLTGEHVSMLRLCGIILICLGVALVAKS